jgi:hypothetical protein
VSNPSSIQLQGGTRDYAVLEKQNVKATNRNNCLSLGVVAELSFNEAINLEVS